MTRTVLAFALTCSVLAASPTAGALEKRAVPDYDGRAEESTDAGDVLIWVPRIVMSPLYLVSEYVIRRPLGWLVTTAEENDWPALVIDAFTFEDGQAGVIPTVLVDFGLEAGFLTSAGLYAFWDDVIVDGNDLRFRFAYAGDDWIQLRFADRYNFDDDTRLGIFGRFDRRMDWVFAGIGPGTTTGGIGRYGEQREEAGLRFQHLFGERGFVRSQASVRNTNYFVGACCDDVSLQQRVAEGYYDEPPAFATGYMAFRQDLELALDTRAVRPGSESGVRFEANAAAGLYLGNDRPGTGWLEYGAGLGGFLDIWNNRTIGLIAQADFRKGIDDQVPFTEMTFLGGAEPMRGFVEGRLRGESAISLTLDYRWPVWVWLDGYLFYQVGNTFGEDLAGFEGGKLRQSFGLGIRPASVEDHSFELLVAFGSDTFDEGGEFTTVRVVFGTASGF